MALAKFESNISSSRGYESKSFSQDFESDRFDKQGVSDFSGNNFVDSLLNTTEDIARFLAIIISIGLAVFAFFFFFYIVISLFKKGGEATLVEMKSFWNWIYSLLAKILFFIKKIVINICSFFWNKKILSFILIGAYFIIGFAGNIIDGKSRILKITNIIPGYVGVDLKNKTISQPGYHIYSPINSDFFLSPTNNFSFDIIDVQANSQEDLPVTLEYRATFKLIDNKRLQFYKENGAKNIRLVSSDIVMPRILEVINGVIKKYSFKDISNKHSEIKTITIEEANKVLSHIGIEINDLNIISIKLPDSYLKSKEDLLKAENELRLSQAQLESQKKESEQKLLQATNLKNVKIIEAEALAEYNKIINSQELTTRMIEMKQLEIEEMKIKKWDGKMPTHMNGGEGFIR